MKIFISWSGKLSLSIAEVLRDWLPSVIQSVEPYVSSEDIDKGARWSTDIAKELEESAFGILCITKDNIEAPWLNFEAGALSKSIDKSRTCPFLFNIRGSEIKNSPLLQFQFTTYEESDVKKLLKSMNIACGSEALEEKRLEKAFEVWWPALEKELEKIKDENKDPSNKVNNNVVTNPDINSILEEILDLTRNQYKLLRNSEILFPKNSLLDTQEKKLLNLIHHTRNIMLWKLSEAKKLLFICKEKEFVSSEEVKRVTSDLVAILELYMKLDRDTDYIEYFINSNKILKETIKEDLEEEVFDK